MRSDPAHLKAIAAYYDDTWFDYRLVWTRRSHLAMHFGYWDKWTRNQAESLVNVNREVAARAGVRPGMRLLDAGAGVGGTAIWLASNFGCRVEAVTVVPSQARRACRFARRRSLGHLVSATRQDYLATAFSPATFDAAYCVESVCHTPHRRELLAELHRVLKPGGRLVVVDGFAAARPLAPAELAFQNRWLAGFVVPPLDSLEDFAAMAADAGFEPVVAEDRTANFAPSCRYLYLLTRVLYPGALALKLMGLRNDVQHGNVKAALGQWQGMNKGHWRYCIVTATKPG